MQIKGSAYQSHLHTPLLLRQSVKNLSILEVADGESKLSSYQKYTVKGQCRRVILAGSTHTRSRSEGILRGIQGFALE